MRSSNRHATMIERRPRRRGSIYLQVLGVAMIISMLGMSAMVAARLRLRAATSRSDLQEAETLSESAVELAIATIANDSNWRSKYVSGEMYPAASALTLGNGKIGWKIVDEHDGDLSNSSQQTARLYGVGAVNDSVYTTSVLLEPTGAGLACLGTAMHSGAQTTLNSGTLDCNQTISSNAGITNFMTANSNAEAVEAITGDNFNGDQYMGVAPRAMPAADSVFDYYLANGTVIDINTVPGYSIRDVVLSSTHNPYGGATNSQGIYIIDCQNRYVSIRDSRIEATLVLINHSSSSELTGALHWEAKPGTNLPALLIQGDITLYRSNANNLSESALGVNFNPASSPYLGESDSDTTDEYPCEIKGLIYVSGRLQGNRPPTISGPLVAAGEITINDDLRLTYQDKYLNDPPPGFGGGEQISIAPGTWRPEATQ